MSARGNISAQLEAPGVNIQIWDYHWDEGEQIYQCEHDFILSYRSHPAQVSVAAKLDDGRLQKFGQLMFFPADVEVNTAAANNNERVRNIQCNFNTEWFRQIWGGSVNIGPDDLYRCYDMRNLRIEQAIQRLGMEAINPGFASKLMVESLSAVVAIEIARYFNGPAEDLRVRTREGRLSQIDLLRITEYIENFETKCPSISDIAHVCNISPAHLRRSFKRTTGQTVHDYVETIRLRKAQKLLVDTDLPLKIISYRLGFANSSTFSSTFRRISGETPSGYRCRARC